MSNPTYASGNETIKWQPEPNLRGIFTIITTCAITLLLCVYSSVHLNLPAAVPLRDFETGVRRLGWILCALFVPEYIIYTAQMQRNKAKQIFKEASEAFKPAGAGTGTETQGDAETGLPPRLHSWTTNHSFWASMGGIAIKPSSNEPFIPNRIRSITLSASGVSLLLKTSPHLLPDISLEEVKDKSKASSITKLLACLQASWFCLSTITRFAQHLSVSMLEVNSFAHALCTLAVYVLWWEKPLDVSQPIYISEEELDPLLAYMWMSSSTSESVARSPEGNKTYAVGTDPEFEAIKLLPEDTFARETKQATSESIQPIYPQEESSDAQSETALTTWTAIRVTPFSPLPGTNFLSNPESTRWVEVCTETVGSGDDREINTTTSNLDPYFNLSRLHAHRWRLAHHALTQYNLDKPVKNMDLVTTGVISETLDDADGTKQSLGGFALMLCLAAGYGALHAVAWNAEFPTQKEKTLWRVSTCIVASPIIIFGLAVLALVPIELLGLSDDPLVVVKPVVAETEPLKYEEKEGEKTQPTEEPSCGKSKGRKVFDFFWWLLKRLAFILLTMAIAVLYVPARAYLVYESVRTVFFLPPGAFETATWTQYMIHVT
ncbi:hypothetical protein WAI453_000649 [Rhynchosporium graminicola]